MTCKVKECYKKIHALKYCNMHYTRLKRYGTLERTKHGINIGCKFNKCISRHYGLGCCKKHYFSIVNKRYNKNRILFQGKSILLKNNPRKNVCSKCGNKGYTHMHHTKYDFNNILKHTKELCPSCHTKEGWKLGQIKGRPRLLKQKEMN